MTVLPPSGSGGPSLLPNLGGGPSPGRGLNPGIQATFHGQLRARPGLLTYLGIGHGNDADGRSLASSCPLGSTIGSQISRVCGRRKSIRGWKIETIGINLSCFLRLDYFHRRVYCL